MRVALCLLTWNELEGCRHDIPLIDRALFDEIFAVDGGSTDGTAAYLESQGIRVLVQPRPGLNAAHLFAVSQCASDHIVFFHPKGSVDVGALAHFRRYFEEGYALVVASRNIKGGRNEEDAQLFRPRKWITAAFAVCAYVLWGREGWMIKDVLHGFRGYSIQAFKRMNISPDGLSIDMESTIKSYKLHLRRVEFPVRERARLSGETHFKTWPTIKHLAKYLWREIIAGSEKG